MSAVRDDLRSVTRRVEIARMAALILLGAIAVAYWVIQIVRGDYYFTLSENNRLRSVAITAARGFILDRHGAILAENAPAYTLYLYRRETKDLDASTNFIVNLLGLSRDDVEKKIARYRSYYDFLPIVIAENLTIGEVAAVEARAPEHPEFAISVGQRRVYEQGPLAAHVLGYLAEASPDQIQQAGNRYRLGEWVGQKGVESAYQELLAGQDGERRVIVDSFGHEIAEESRVDALPGRNLTTTLDLGLEKVAEEAFKNRVGSIVALDPRTGEILALYSSPGYDPNLFAQRISTSDWTALMSNPDHPLQNRAIQNMYSPGSVFKIFMAYAGLQSGLITPDTRVFCPGFARFYGRTFRCWKKDGHGWMSLRQAIAQSCDVYFYTLGNRLGIDRIAAAAKAFGFGSPTGVDLPYEKRGLVPSELWARTIRRARWYPSETISVSIGQGPLLMTPLQMARATAGLAEGGVLATPHLFLRSDDPRTGETLQYVPEIHRSVEIPSDIVDVIKDGMYGAVNAPGGTAYASRIPGISVCGKTGTSQVVSFGVRSSLPYQYRDHAWFTAFAPKDDPRIVVTVFVEHGGHGASAAAPIARAIIAKFFGVEVPPPPPAEPPPPAGKRGETIAGMTR
jgi:penicillin-binding protein 2